MVDDLEWLPLVGILGGGSVDDGTIGLECFGSERNRGEEGTVDGDAGRRVAGAGVAGGGGRKKRGTYWGERIRSGRRERVLNILRHRDRGEGSDVNGSRDDWGCTTTVDPETLDTAVGVHFDHDVGGVGGRSAGGEREEVATSRTEFGAREKSEPVSRGGGDGGGVVVDCAEKFGGFGEVAEEVSGVYFCVGQEAWLATAISKRR